jgi:hypothetical protein
MKININIFSVTNFIIHIIDSLISTFVISLKIILINYVCIYFYVYTNLLYYLLHKIIFRFVFYVFRYKSGKSVCNKIQVFGTVTFRQK